MDNDYILKLLQALKWPLLVLILGIFFILVFRKPLSNILARIRSIGKRGIDINVSPQLENEDKRKAAVDELMRVGDSSVLIELENAILKDLNERGLETHGDSIKILTKHLAITQLALDFEQIYHLIFGSQIKLLKRLNQSLGVGLSKEDVEDYFETIKIAFPEVIRNWNLADYLSFLLSRALITRQENNYHITIKGIEFLIWMIRTGHLEDKDL